MSDAVTFAQWKAARRLLERGAKTTFIQAAALGLLELVREYFASQAPLQEEITKALWHACRGGNMETVQFLVAQGGDVNWIGWDHHTSLDVARQSGNPDLITWLRENAP